MFIRVFIFSLCILLANHSFAANITLDADERVEYHQKEQKLIAKGNAIASKDNMSIKASTLIGYYDKTSKNKISKYIFKTYCFSGNDR